jgi:uncharacterized membrane protein YdjX (TVP38/TMEM64 family)
LAVKLLSIIVIAAALIAAAKYYNLQHLFMATLEWIENAGALGLIVFFILYVLATVLMLPGVILTLGAGVVFGVVKGSLLVSLSSTAGATAAFLIGRYIARSWVEGKIESNATLQAMDKALGKEGWKIVGLTRLSPVVPYNVLNYAFSLTRVSLRDYVIASWIGMIPATVLYIYIGSLAGSLAELGANRTGHVRTPAEWTLYTVGLAATGAVTIIITRIARRALKQRINTAEEVETKRP